MCVCVIYAAITHVIYVTALFAENIMLRFNDRFEIGIVKQSSRKLRKLTNPQCQRNSTRVSSVYLTVAITFTPSGSFTDKKTQCASAHLSC